MNRMRTQCDVSSASVKFGKYKSESESPTRALSEKTGKNLRQLLEAWEWFPYEVSFHTENYESALEMVRGIKYRAKDVEHLSLALSAFENERNFHDKAGWFISALVNAGKNSRYIIHSFGEIDNVGYRNIKNLTVKGDVGYGCARQMQGGRFVVEGNAGNCLATALAGGKVIVKNAGESIGAMMAGGEVHILGGYKSISSDGRSFCGGKIFHNGEKIVDGLWAKEGITYD